MNTPGFKRKLSAIFMADVVGYSRLMGEDETATLQTLTIYHGVMDGLIRQHRGRVVDAPGDAVLAEFSSVVDAVQCAVAVQKELQARNAELPENSRMQFRIGINLGDVIEEGDKIYGDGVNIAARLEALAEPGGICVSKTAFDHIETKLPLGYEFLGEKTVKNIARPVGAYRVLLEPRVTVAGEIDQVKPQPRRFLKAIVAAGLVLFMAAISLAFWKSGFLSSQPAKQIAATGPQIPAPPPTGVTPSPPGVSQAPVASLPKKASPKVAAPSSQAAPPTKVAPPVASPTQVAPSPPGASQTQVASLPKEAAKTPATPAPQVAPPDRVAPATPGKGIPFFNQLDANKDGKVTLAEFQLWRDAQFDALDTNKDGSLSRQEVSAGNTRFSRLIGQNFDLIDTNQDQRLSREEFRAAGRRRFLMLDADRDGYLTPQELAKAGQD